MTHQICADILQFQEQLKKLRDLDDNVIYALNKSLPTSSIKARTESNPEKNCRGLFESLRSSYQRREELIDTCIKITADDLSQLKRQKESSDDVQLQKRFKAEQRKLRVLKTEKSVEDIVKDKTIKAFNERCRSFYKAEAF